MENFLGPVFCWGIVEVHDPCPPKMVLTLTLRIDDGDGGNVDNVFDFVVLL